MQSSSVDIHPTKSGFQIWGMTWAHFLNDGSANYLPGILPAILISLHEPVSMAGALMAALLIGQALQPLMGWIADQIGGKGMIILGISASSVGGALLGLTDSVAALTGFLLLIGVGNSMFHPQALASVRGLVHSRQGLGLSVFLVGGELGRGLWPVMASLLVVRYGLPSLLVLGVPAVLTLPFLVRYAPRQTPQRGKGGRIDWSRHTVSTSLLLGLAGIRSTVTYAMVTFLPILWHFRGGSLVSGASIVSTLIAVGIAGNLLGGYMMDQIGRQPVLLVSTVVMAVLVPTVVIVRGQWIWVVAAILGSMLFAGSSATISIGQDIFAENRSMGSGIALGLANGIGAVLVLIIGLFVNRHDIPLIFGLLGAATLLSTVIIFFLPRHLEPA